MSELDRLVKNIVTWKAAAGPAKPDRLRRLTGRMFMPWHVRTMILPIPKGKRLKVIVVNLLVGRVGVSGFDDLPGSRKARNECRLVALAVGENMSLADTFTFDREEALREKNGERFDIRGRNFTYGMSGKWPRYSTELRVAEWQLELRLETECVAPIVWWNDMHPLYSHYSAFGRATGTAAVGGKREAIADWISLEHGTGINLLGLPGKPEAPLSMFHYQLGSFESGETFAFGCASALGVETFRRGALITREGRFHKITGFEMNDVRLAAIPDRRGGEIEVPTSFDVSAGSPELSLRYSARTLSTPVAGSGRLTGGGAVIEGELQLPKGNKKQVSGSLYIEHKYDPNANPLP